MGSFVGVFCNDNMYMCMCEGRIKIPILTDTRKKEQIKVEKEGSKGSGK